MEAITNVLTLVWSLPWTILANFIGLLKESAVKNILTQIISASASLWCLPLYIFVMLIGILAKFLNDIMTYIYALYKAILSTYKLFYDIIIDERRKTNDI